MSSVEIKKPIKIIRFLSKLKYKIIRKVPTGMLVKQVQKALVGANPIEAIHGRVVLVCASLEMGGAERQIVNTLFGLKKDKFENVVLLCFDPQNSHEESKETYLSLAQSSGWEIRRVRTNWDDSCLSDRPKQIDILKNYINRGLGDDVINLYHELRELKPEVVHSWLDWVNVRAGLASILAGAPKIVLSGRSVSPKHFALNVYYFNPVYRALAKYRSDRVKILNNSQAGAIDYADWLSVSKERIGVLRNGVNLTNKDRLSADDRNEFKNQLGIPEDGIIVGGMFRLNVEKDPMLWIQVARYLVNKNSNVFFIIFGDGLLRLDMENAIKEYGLTKNIQLYGKISPAIKGLSVCDVVLLTSHKEGTPNVLLEAQWLGVPVVTTNAGGAAEAVQNGVTGIVVNSRNPGLISNAIEKCIDAEFVSIASSKGPSFVAEHYGMQRMIQETISIYNMERGSENESLGEKV